MSDDFAIQVDHVSKRFSLSTSRGGTLKHLVVDSFRRRPVKTFDALTDISFSLKQGKTLGIIGRNGAGKSTLLSIIAGTMSPTSGRVVSNGKISSLLELGAGFHPDLTGRENVYLYGAIMGVPKAVMRKRFDAIVWFAGIGDFIDQPVRFYSSGMYVRLGFSVAVQIDPDILLVDEVLAVGDGDFQQRCMERMKAFRLSGKTLVLISHDLGAIQAISDQIAILDHGRIVDIGEPSKMVELYQNVLSNTQLTVAKEEWGTREAILTKVELLGMDGQPTRAIGEDRIIRARVTYEASHRIETPVFGFNLEHLKYGNLFGSNTQLENYEIPFVEKGTGHVLFEIDASRLQKGCYQMSFSMHSSNHLVNYHRLEHALTFYVDTPPRVFDGLFVFDTRCRKLD